MILTMLNSLDRLLAHTVSVASYQSFFIQHLDWLTTFEFHKEMIEDIEEHPVTVMGLRFPNRVGIAAGIDVNGEAVSAFGGLGVGFVEVGPVSISCQKHSAEIARDFSQKTIVVSSLPPSNGIDQLTLKNAQAFRLRGGVVGIRIDNSSDDILFEKAYLRSDYLSIAIPPESDASAILERLAAQRHTLTLNGHPYKPIVLELPSGRDTPLNPIVKAAEQAQLDGFMTPAGMVTQTAMLYGRPVYSQTIELLDTLRGMTTLPIIAKGGILSPEDARRVLDHGANLVQLGSALLFCGLKTIGTITKKLSFSL